MYDFAPSEKYKVKPKLEKYAMENGIRSFVSRCLTWFMGPMSTEKPNITSRLPKLKAKANFAGRIASNGKVKKAIKKQATAPSKHAPNPSNLSHLDNAK